MKSKKLTRTYRLSETTIRQIEGLAEMYHISQAEVIAVMAHGTWMNLDRNKFNDYFELAKNA